MKKIIAIYYRLQAKKRDIAINKAKGVRNYVNSIRNYAGHILLNADEANEFIYNKIISGESFLAGRFGSTELLNVRYYDFGGFIGEKYNVDFHFNHLCEWSGFFPHNISLLPKFAEEIKAACKELDFLGVWFQPFEDYYIKNIMSDELAVSYLLDFEPWSARVHWSAALKGKKVLVIHPFENTIRKQYNLNRKNIFSNSDILPEFELHTLKAIQTLAGAVDPRFETWFDALEWMYQEAMKIDFDIAVIGCGAYGLPLAAKIKKAGKQAIHLGGATQLLFGIKGKRWEENDAFDYVKKQFNENWVYPEEDKPKGGDKVEGGCYWR